MGSAFPFSVTYNEDALHDDAPWQLYQVAARFDEPALSDYRALSDKYSRENHRISLVDVTVLIIEERAPQVLDHAEFDEEGYWLDLYLDSQKAMQQFVDAVCPVFQNLDLLAGYMQRIAYRDRDL